MKNLIPPYGGQAVDLLVAAERAEALKKEALNLPSLDLDWRQLGELEMLMSGAYAPLRGYMGRGDYERVLEKLELTDGTSWPLPLTLRLNNSQAAGLKPGDRVALRDSEGFMLGVLELGELWQADPMRDGELLARSSVPGVELADSGWHAGGTLEGVSLPMHHDFATLRMTPAELRAQLARRGWRRIVAYLTGQPLHRAQFEFCLRTSIEQEANLLLLPFGGGDLISHAGYFTLMRAFQAIMPRFPAVTTQLAMLPIVPPPPGLRDKLMRLILARNYGCSHVIVGGEYADKGQARRGVDVQASGGFDVLEQAKRMGMTMISFPRMRYVEDREEYVRETDLQEDARGISLGGEEFQRRLQAGLKIPDWYAFS